MRELFSLGKIYPSDFLKPDEQPRSEPVELKLMMDDDGVACLELRASLEQYFGKYFYRSGINTTMKNELHNIVDSITNIYNLEINGWKQDLWIDIACNDGTLLSFVPKNLIRVGIDPADDTYKVESEQHSDLIIQDFFSADVFKKSIYGNKKADVITSIAMFYDIEESEKFIADISEVLDDNGLWVLQLSYTPLMLKQLAFDNILGEHIKYYSLFNLKNLFNRCGFKIMDCQLNDINGGSFRVYAMKQGADESKFGSQPHRDVCNFRINSLLEYEKTLALDSAETWAQFKRDIDALKEATVSFIKEQKALGKTIMGYGASTKFNTLLQYFGIDHTLISAIAERSPYKYGLRTVGTDIPIISEEQMRAARPDFLLIGPWHFINEFKARESEYLRTGGKMIVPCPILIIVSS